MNRPPPRQPVAVPVREPRSFGKRTQPVSITLARNGRERRFAINPFVAVSGICLFLMFSAGYLGSTAYLMLRDDLIGMTHARNARLLHEYEDRIAALRTNLDRVTSRQLLDQKAIEANVQKLIKRQEQLGNRNSRLGIALQEAGNLGLAPSLSATSQDAADPVTTGSVERLAPPSGAESGSIGFSLRGSAGIGGADEANTRRSFVAASPDMTDYGQAQSLFANMRESIETVDRQQRTLVEGLRRKANERSARIARVLNRLKVATSSDDAVGGPYVPVEPRADFEAQVDALDQSLKNLRTLSTDLVRVPVASPAPNAPLSSPFGVRSDPFLGKLAMHSGLDFRATYGSPVLAAADGKVLDAGRNGGYGNLVEIGHGNGLSTRYAHLSRIAVKSGQSVKRGTVVGWVGSTGRSTGPHLHYEIRRGGLAVDPAAYVKAGRELADAMGGKAG